MKTIKNHPMYNAEDFNYLQNKGYTNEEIISIWDEQLKGQKGKCTHNIKFVNVVGYLNK